jgi:hypothetical protein
MYADRRTFLGDDGKPIVPPGPLSVFVFSYKEPEKWAVFAKTTEAELTAEWPGKLKTNPNVQVTLKNSLL